VKGLHKQRREITSLRRALPSVDAQKILQRVAKKYGVDRQRLVAPGERALQARNVAIWMVWETGSKSLREIGKLFGGLDYLSTRPFWEQRNAVRFPFWFRIFVDSINPRRIAASNPQTLLLTANRVFSE
jgi:hypothetical protein